MKWSKVGGLKYTVIFSRYLNENDNEDVAYLVGQQPLKEDIELLRRLPRSQEHLARNQGPGQPADDHRRRRQRLQRAAERKRIRLSVRRQLEENEQIPVLDSTAQMGAIQGSVAIFELPEEVSANRPLLLHIPGPPGESGVVKIDL